MPEADPAERVVDRREPGTDTEAAPPTWTAKRRAAPRIELPCSTARTMRRRRSNEIGAGMTTSRLSQPTLSSHECRLYAIGKCSRAGEHVAIIDQRTWDKVHAVMTDPAHRRGAATQPCGDGAMNETRVAALVPSINAQPHAIATILRREALEGDYDRELSRWPTETTYEVADLARVQGSIAAAVAALPKDAECIVELALAGRVALYALDATGVSFAPANRLRAVGAAARTVRRRGNNRPEAGLSGVSNSESAAAGEKHWALRHPEPPRPRTLHREPK